MIRTGRSGQEVCALAGKAKAGKAKRPRRVAFMCFPPKAVLNYTASAKERKNLPHPRAIGTATAPMTSMPYNELRALAPAAPAEFGAIA